MPSFKHADGRTWEIDGIGGLLAMVSRRPAQPEPKLTFYNARESGESYKHKLIEKRISEGYTLASSEAPQAMAALKAWLTEEPKTSDPYEKVEQLCQGAEILMADGQIDKAVDRLVKALRAKFSNSDGREWGLETIEQMVFTILEAHAETERSFQFKEALFFAALGAASDRRNNVAQFLFRVLEGLADPEGIYHPISEAQLEAICACFASSEDRQLVEDARLFAHIMSGNIDEQTRMRCRSSERQDIESALSIFLDGNPPEAAAERARALLRELEKT